MIKDTRVAQDVYLDLRYLTQSYFTMHLVDRTTE